MATFDDVRRIAMTFPGAQERESGWRMGPMWRLEKGGLFVWSRPLGKKDVADLEELGAEVPDGDIVGVRVADEEAKAAVIEAFPDVFFTIPHFNGYAAVLIRLERIASDHLAEMVADSWLLRAPKRVAREWLEAHPTTPQG